MTALSLHDAIRRRFDRDDRGSLPMLMLVMIATVALGAIMLANVLTSLHSTTYVQTRVQTLNAAESGINTMLGKLRAATSSSNVTIGDSNRLQCWSLNGPANAAGTTSYSVSIAYYGVDPSTLSSTDLNAAAMKCTGSGPYNPTTGIHTPRYALITSTGTGPSGPNTSASRTLQTTYNFQVLDQNIPGGQIRIYPASSSQTVQWCMDAGSTPAVGTSITLNQCSTSTPPAAQQVWEYRQDLSIELVSSVTNPNSAGLCIDTAASPTSHAAGNSILLERCAVADSSVCPAGMSPTAYHTANPTLTCAVSPWNQQWSVDDNAHLEGATTDQSNIDGYCITAPTQPTTTPLPTSAGALTLQSCAGGTTDSAQTWVPAPTAGAGMAGAGNQQLVNFQQFATCLDVTGQNVTSSFMILYTCKQNPKASQVAFNQKFIPSPALTVAPTQVLLTVVNGSNTYCLQSPSTGGTATSTSYPVLVQQGSGPGQCPSTVAAAAGTNFVWTVSQLYADSGKNNVLSYANRYTIKDWNNLCLAPGSSADLYNGAYYKAVVASCNGSTAQKWNASPSLAAAALTNTVEISGTTGTSGSS